MSDTYHQRNQDMTTQTQQLGSVELGIAKAIANESIALKILPYMTMRRFGFNALKDKELYSAVLEIHKSIVNPPPSPARAKAQQAQLARIAAGKEAL